MSNTILFGALGTGEVFRYQQDQLDDDGTPVSLRATSQIWAPNTWWGEALWRSVTVVISANVGVTCLITPIVDDHKYDGTNGYPDTRVTFTLDAPSPGERATRRTLVGLYRPITIDGTDYGRTGLRGTWIQFQIDTVGAIVVPATETNPDLRFDGLDLDVEPLNNRQQVSNA
ncbi:MAG TPA: hypothetical protein VM487_09625 [Phycisphaerae bacterium]|nr:hypothetical protein [Phycisphaerae bacterium]